MKWFGRVITLSAFLLATLGMGNAIGATVNGYIKENLGCPNK